MKPRVLIAILFVLHIYLLCVSCNKAFSQDKGKFTIARLKYNGGGDWYANPSSLPNLLKFMRENTKLETAEREIIVSLEDGSIFNCPITYITGHGRIVFSKREAATLRKYLRGGGFLFIDDNFGLDKYIREEIKKVFPKEKLIKLPFEHKIFKKPFVFETGLPKIHKHHGGPAQAWALFHNGRMVIFYSYNTDLGDGWEDFEVHKDPEEKRQKALKMGVNVIFFAISQM